ncbi:hypothetical protein D0Z00_004599 [Geotrichum galactomycetum]|uniref:Uncharacterized protein n=1 Tax=Geotrichum galactomycetum TaxID=27317 RepID=A0ACB6UXZ3_9ASCO|nr:hypothetical protein D0Z00_004599 [Geotrichum candidum]
MSDDDCSLYTSQTNEDEDDLFDKTEAASSASPAPPDEPMLIEEGEQYERLKEQNKKYCRPFLSKNADDSSKNSATGLVQPKLLTGAKLHEYQLEGVAWLISLYENGLNGILADDMGLGKTIQTIAFMAYLVENNMQLYEMIAQGKLREFLEEELLKTYDPKGKKGFRQRFERERGKTRLNDYKNEFTFDFSEYDDIFGDIEETDADESGQVKYRITESLGISDEEEGQKQQKADYKRKRKMMRTGLVPSKRQRKYNDEYQEYVRDKRRYLHKNMLNYQHSLRMSCGSSLLLNYPFNLTNDEELTNVLKYSAKMKSLEHLCKGLFTRGHRAIIFSQFLGMLDIIEDWATQTMKWKVCRIDGQTPVDVRQEQMELFRTDESYPVFLVSTRSGGLGINLTSADTVILFDSDWNPQIDLQAMDRAHRIGQSRPVVVYRLAVRSSFEERVIQLANKKKELEQVVIEEGNFSGLLTATEAEESELYQERLHQQIVKLLKTVGSKNNLQLLRDDFEKFGPAYSPLAEQAVLDKILDRTDTAYANHETQQLGDFIVPIF